MKRQFWILAALAALTGAASWTLWAQQPPRGKANGGQNGSGEPSQADELPTDPLLLKLQVEFVKKAKKLALDYERGKDLDKARMVYEQILKVAPKNPEALEKLEQFRQDEASAERKVVEVYANKDWQPTGVQVVPGKPVQIQATGEWTVNISHELGPNGMEIPKELRDFNLGSLVGVIDNGSGNPEEFTPFYIGPQYEFIADAPGRLLLSMWDSDHSDNAGKLSVEIRGTFERAAR